MPPKRNAAEAVIFLVNVGRETAEILDNENQSFLDKAKTVIRQILERKIFLRKKDAVNIILFGSNETDNDENIDNIFQFESGLQVPDWEMVERVLDLRATEHTSNWVEGLHVALRFAQFKCTDFEDVKVIVINNFKESQDVIQQFNAKDVASEIFSSHVKLMFISNEDLFGRNREDLNLSEQLAVRVYRDVERMTPGGTSCAYDQIDNYLLVTRFYKNPPVKPTPWESFMKIGSILIPIQSYVKVTEPAPFPSWKLTTRSDSVGFPPETDAGVKRTRELVDRHRNVVDEANTNKGYKYGGQFVPLTDNDRERAKLTGTVKSLTVRGFVKIEEVSLEHWFAKGVHIIVPECNSQAKEKFYSLLINMKKLGLVAIVRKVYQTNSQPKMGILFPRFEKGEIACLVHIGLPFIEERRVLKPREEVNSLNEEQKQDIDNYIDAMTISEDDERFRPGSFCNPFKQTKWDHLSNRALNRDPPLSMDQYLIDLVSTPRDLLERSQPALERLATWVKPKPVVIKKKEDENEPIVKVEENDIKTEEELIQAAIEAEKEIKKKDEIFNEIMQTSMNDDDDHLFDDL
ncbi:X-ray repair cross-complementing protein 5-like [Leptopilina heterotoma]|uniref:X-ray repair cross-complementing protein 5-like n=1 Tax=Leptopilina heterotoma TaxID=63436 RepID=UPI001CA9152C|nr:X-ray repair cross-complementing protein 5-like [Leptopilina heterotoma]